MLGKVEEMQLIAECVLLDKRESFGRLVEEYQDGLRRFLLNLTLGDVMLCEDLTQETFIKAYVNLRNFKGISRFKTWLYRIACNQYYTYMASVKKECDIDNALSVAEAPASNAIDASIDAMECMRSLSDTERTVVTLFYLEDVSLKDISKITSLKENTVKSHLLRAKQKMKLLLETDRYEQRN